MVATVAEWENVRRAELLQHFRERIYGQPLPAPTAIRFAVTATDFASVTRKIATITVAGPHGSRSFKVRLGPSSPAATAAPPAVFLLIDHRSDVTGGPARNTPVLSRPGHHERRGYAVAAFRCGRGGTRRSGDIPHRESSICSMQAEDRRFRDSARAGGGVPSGAGQRAVVMDYLVTDRAVDGKRCFAVVGHCHASGGRGVPAGQVGGAGSPGSPSSSLVDLGTAGAKLRGAAHCGRGPGDQQGIPASSDGKHRRSQAPTVLAIRRRGMPC